MTQLKHFQVQVTIIEFVLINIIHTHYTFKAKKVYRSMSSLYLEIER